MRDINKYFKNVIIHYDNKMLMFIKKARVSSLTDKMMCEYVEI